MTTAAERIAEITARAKARGLTATPVRTSPVRFSEPTPRPVTPDRRTATEKAVDASLTRPLPVSWHGKHRDAVDACRRIETRTAARLVAKALGDGWRTVIDDEMRWSTLRLAHPSGLQLNFSLSWSDSRYSISAIDCVRRDDLDSITVAANRTPLAIAGDIRRRILDRGAFGAHAEHVANRQADRDKRTADRLLILRMAKAAGEFKLASRPNQCGYPSTNRIELPGGILSVEADYLGRIALNLTAHAGKIGLIEEIIRLVRNYPEQETVTDG